MAAALPPPPPARVLVVSATAGFRHGSIPAARRAVVALDRAAPGWTARLTEDLAELAPAGLARYRAVVFLLTSGELALPPGGRAGLVAFVRRGGGFVGVHSATDTLHGFPPYGRLVGAYFRAHPTARGRARVARRHPLTAGLTSPVPVDDEIYEFRSDPRDAGARVLLTVDPDGPVPPLPSAWCRVEGRGRVAYTALGHRPELWSEGWWRRHVGNAIAWAASPGGRC